MMVMMMMTYILTRTFSIETSTVMKNGVFIVTAVKTSNLTSTVILVKKSINLFVLVAQ
jgi:hypothetical protein